MDIYNLLRKLTETPGPSGLEVALRETLIDVWRPLADEITVDRMGNLLALKRGSDASSATGNGEQKRQPRLLLAAHMDEIALMVKKIDQYDPEGNGEGGGFLLVTSVGGVDVRHLYGQAVVVHGQNDLPGIIGALPKSMLPDANSSKVYGFDELVVDVGLSADELRKQVSVGDFISFHQRLRKLLNDRVSGKALDNRASVAAVTTALEYLQGRRHEWDVIAVATTQEETRLLGAFTSAFAQHPDVAVAVDVTFAKGPGTKDNQLFEMDEGPTVGLGPNVHPGVQKKLQDAAEALEMKVHTDPHSSRSGTDAYGLQIAREGIPTGLVGIPLRYMHTMVETVATADVERAGRLLGEFAARLDEGFLEEIAKEMVER
ncbi:MAG TPA: M28 family peptidase [Candidatus Binatia bacterium]|nr:M28 family peptidase [Candidatus Binatia bacterium]